MKGWGRQKHRGVRSELVFAYLVVMVSLVMSLCPPSLSISLSLFQNHGSHYATLQPLRVLFLPLFGDSKTCLAFPRTVSSSSTMYSGFPFFVFCGRPVSFSPGVHPPFSLCIVFVIPREQGIKSNENQPHTSSPLSRNTNKKKVEWREHFRKRRGRNKKGEHQRPPDTPCAKQNNKRIHITSLPYP